MASRVAIGSSDGQWIDQHFGSCEQFMIYDVSAEGEWTLAEVRKTGSDGFTGRHSQEQLNKIIGLLSDCSTVLVSRIGMGVGEELKERGIAFSTDYISLKHAQEKLATA
ncbi:putative Fe-Mo cluster-binding NifX family protein [Paenibacillus forsythiae]|uniref:Fe-Mo cluster-binding NifX family protein n=1 Tax=Paenibacillus forsythiae TaxID=365616 RepID=A0ABU3H992_9BACL|nr:NifB/NifX family molybdenum-iron cluster-binding protein [Paenibacillus forsythiae]MDT3427295.1 putative Fe-Mo cluster-binding NifX family protein [Paenibacillus forsythiae]